MDRTKKQGDKKEQGAFLKKIKAKQQANIDKLEG
jgi:hypothetical protein